MASFKQVLLRVCCAASMSIGTFALAQDTDQDASHNRTLVLAKIKAISNEPAAREIAIAKGHDRVMLCTHCHGEDGNSTRQEIPNLAGQNPAYLMEQIEKFADGRRKNFVMQTLAADFSVDDKVNLAIYYASFEPNRTLSDPVVTARGKELYSSVCQFCHGADGRGEAGYARLAGQKPVYVQETLKRFRTNAATPGADDTQRSNPRMEQVTQRLSDEDIEALAAYIAQMP